MTLKRARRGFSLIEVLVASAIFLVAFTSLSAFVSMTANRRLLAGKRASMSRLATDEYAKYLQQGFNALVQPPAPYKRFDPNGREATFTVTVNPNCLDPGLPASSIKTTPLPSNTQTCCTGNLCCKALQLTMTWKDGSQSTTAPTTMTEQYFGFVTKSCT